MQRAPAGGFGLLCRLGSENRRNRLPILGGVEERYEFDEGDYIRSVEAQLMYYLQWPPSTLDKLNEEQFWTAWYNLKWIRKKEEEMQKKQEANRARKT